MKKFFIIIMSLILFTHPCRCVAFYDCFLTPKVVFGSEMSSRSIFDEEKAEYFNNLMRRLWNKDFGKFLQAFCVWFFKKCDTVDPKDLQQIPFTSRTVEVVELMMFYLCTVSLNKCVVFFREMIGFFKCYFHDEKKEVVLQKLREFTCCGLIEVFKYGLITKELIAEKYLIMSELYD